MLALGCVASAGAQTVQTFAVVGDYGSGGKGPDDVVKKAAKGVADQLAIQNPSFVLSLGDQLYGPFPIPAGSNGHAFETVPLAASDAAGGYGNAVGKLYNQFILPNPSLTASLGNNAGTAGTMNFFPVLGDHDWRHETVQADPATGALITNATSGCCDGFTPNFAYGTVPNTDANAQFYANAAQAFAATQQYVTGPGLAKNSISALVFGPPGTPLNGDSYATYFSGLANLASQTPSGTVRWYDTTQGAVHVFALSSDPNELYQGGLKTVDAQDSGAAQKNLAGVQGQWFTSALKASTATWNIVEFHNPAASATIPEEGALPNTSNDGHLSANYMQWFDGTKIDLVLAGHIHGYERLQNNGIVYINNGSGGTFEGFTNFCNQPGAAAAGSCSLTYQVAPSFANALSTISGTTSSNQQMVALTQMQVANTYGYQLVSIDTSNNFLRSQFFGSLDPGGATPNWTLLDDFFILKNGTLAPDLANSATGLLLKPLDGAAFSSNVIQTNVGITPATVQLNAVISGTGQLTVTGGGTLILGAPASSIGDTTTGLFTTATFATASDVPAVPGTGQAGTPYQYAAGAAIAGQSLNSYSGGTYVTDNSTLQVTHDSFLGDPSGALTLDSGTLRTAATFTIRALDRSGTRGRHDRQRR